MSISVESICNTLARNQLLPKDEIVSLRQRWLREAGPSAADAHLFGKWLATKNYITDYQSGILVGRRNERLRLGPYKIVSRIVQGRLAGVYKAVHSQGQIVAIKVLPPSRAADPAQLGRFQREARLAVKLQHPNVVRTFQAGEDGGVHYLAMEYLEGSTLKEVLQQRGRLPVAEVVRLIYQALQGLQHIHEVGMVHRDLEPGNLMLVASETAEPDETTLHSTLKILDIGLGRALFDEGSPATGTPIFVTTAGDQLGTPEYRSPEQARDPSRVDIRADIYSLGCVFYQALVGDPPFMDKNPVNLMLRHSREPASPLKAFNVNVPPGLQQVLDGMLAKDPAMRFPTPERAARELRGYLSV
jgi:serine/threonine protein kinase